MEFLRGGNCFYFSGTFIYYIAGILNAFRGVNLYIALTDTYLTRLLFQRIESPTFYCNDFTFELCTRKCCCTLTTVNVSEEHRSQMLHSSLIPKK